MRYAIALLAVLLVPVAGAAAATTPGPPGSLVGQAQCKALGYSVGTSEFTGCLANGGTSKTTPPTGSSTQPKATLARLTCRSFGLKQGTQAFTRCLARQLKLLRHAKVLAP